MHRAAVVGVLAGVLVAGGTAVAAWSLLNRTSFDVPAVPTKVATSPRPGPSSVPATSPAPKPSHPSSTSPSTTPEPAPTPGDRRAPEAVRGFRLVSNTSSEFTVAWEPATDDVGVAYYQVLLNGVLTAQTTIPQVTLDFPADGSSGRVDVAAVDAAGNSSEWRGVVIVPPPSPTPSATVTPPPSAGPTPSPGASSAATPSPGASPTVPPSTSSSSPPPGALATR